MRVCMCLFLGDPRYSQVIFWFSRVSEGFPGKRDQRVQYHYKEHISLIHASFWGVAPTSSHTFLAKSEGLTPPCFPYICKNVGSTPPTPEPVGVGDVYCVPGNCHVSSSWWRSSSSSLSASLSPSLSASSSQTSYHARNWVGSLVGPDEAEQARSSEVEKVLHRFLD